MSRRPPSSQRTDTLFPSIEIFRSLRGIDLEVHPGEIVTLIGANGAGKSTLLMTICGNPRARLGEIRFEGENITSMPTFEIMRRNIAQSAEGRSEAHTSELQSLLRNSYAVFCMKKNRQMQTN